MLNVENFIIKPPDSSLPLKAFTLIQLHYVTDTAIKFEFN